MQTTAGEIMSRSASLLNDTARSLYTYSAQVPYLNIAMDELQELFEEHNIPSTNKESAVVEVPASSSVTEIGFSNGLPADLIEIQQLWERYTGSNDYDWIPVKRKDYLPKNQTIINQLIYWTWQDEKIKLPPCDGDNDIKFDYIKSLFTTVQDENTVISVINCKTFLSYRNAALCAQYIGENESRAEGLNTSAALAIGRALNINVKGMQTQIGRRRPFMSSYRRSGFLG
jgi:hypothetical protein